MSTRIMESSHSSKKQKLEQQELMRTSSTTSPPLMLLKDDAENHEKKKVVTQQHSQKQHTNPEVLKVRHSIQACCKSNDLDTALLRYKEAQSCGIWIEPQTYYCLLALCDGLDTRGLHIGTPRPSATNDQQQKKSSATITPEERKNHAFEIKQTMDNLKINFSETAFTSLVRVLCKAKQSAMAEEILTQAESAANIKLKLRMYSAVIQAFSEDRQMSKILSLWKRMLKRNIVPTEREYAHILKCAVHVGNAEVVDRVLADLAEDVLVPSNETTRTIIDWFTSPFSSSTAAKSSTLEEDSGSITNVAEILGETTAPSMGPVTSNNGWSFSDGCRIDTTSGMLLDGCLANYFLKPVELSTTDRLEMMRMNETIVRNDGLPSDPSAYAGGGKGKKRKSTDKNMRIKIWDSFKAWLDRQVVGRPFEVVLDGANIGYYKQNYANAPKYVDYNQIDWVVRHFRREKKRILLVLHERHFSPKLMPDWAIPITKRWESNDGLVSLFRAPAGCNDDWFWLHAALQCGKDCMVLTNDEMRDHHFQMLAYRSFLRWKERHQIRFQFGEWVTTTGEGKQRHREVKALFPDVYSRRIQRVERGIIVPLPKKGDEDRFLDGNFVSEDDPEEETYVCIVENNVV
mmetsp:Transcript_17474/g.24877  ORF Transcript_17474/g.24877 Transcript_17474/m.24877 type:complete len:629 (-) Transcript_17474:1798-3684(-)